MTTHIAATEMRRSRHDSGVRRKPITDVSGRGRTSSSKIQAVVARPTLPLTSKPINSDNVQSGPAVVAEPVEQAAATVRNTVPAAVINPQTASQSESVAPLRSESVVNQPASKGSLFRPPPVRNRIVSARSEIDTTVEKTPLAPPAPARSPSSQSQRAPAPIALGASDPNQRPDAPPPSRRISAISTVRRPSDIDEQARGLEPRTKEISQIVSPSAKQPSIARRQSGSSGWSTYDNRSNGTSATKRRRSAVVSDDPFATEFKKAAAERMKVDEQKKERRLSKIESATKASRANSNRFFTGEDFSVNADENSMLFATSAALSSVNGNMVTGVDGAGQMLNQLGGASTVNLPVSYVLDDALHSAKLVTLSPMVVELICSFPLPTLEQRFEINLPMEHEGTWMPVHLYGKLLRVPEERGKESSITVHIERVHEPKGFEGSYARFCNQANQQ
ncbi:MAG TPA: hypothetical protein DCQ06_12985 [Myxococcales bacterium]|nr:hypothetical protein [Myxococcales bacterium]